MEGDYYNYYIARILLNTAADSENGSAHPQRAPSNNEIGKAGGLLLKDLRYLDLAVECVRVGFRRGDHAVPEELWSTGSRGRRRRRRRDGRATVSSSLSFQWVTLCVWSPLCQTTVSEWASEHRFNHAPPPFTRSHSEALAWLSHCDNYNLKSHRRVDNMSRMNLSGYVGHVLHLVECSLSSAVE